MILLEEYMRKPFLNSIKKKTGFTLAEVLVTLAIIGVVASLTIPGLIQNTKNAQTVTALKKSYATFSQAFTSVKAEDINLHELFHGSAVEAFDEFAAKLNVTKNCGIAPGCFPDVSYIPLNGDTTWPNNINSGGNPMGILADGSSFYIASFAGCWVNFGGDSPNVCGEIAVDINGFKGPNQFGRDLFFFFVTENGIVPFGAYSGDAASYGDCNTGSYGFGCAYTVLTSGAINY